MKKLKHNGLSLKYRGLILILRLTCTLAASPRSVAADTAADGLTDALLNSTRPRFTLGYLGAASNTWSVKFTLWTSL